MLHESEIFADGPLNAQSAITTSVEGLDVADMKVAVQGGLEGNAGLVQAARRRLSTEY